MNSAVVIYPEGRKLFAERIAKNVDRRIDGMYLEYSDGQAVDTTGRSPAYYDMLSGHPRSGYARIAVHDIAVNDDGSIKITGLFSSSDLKGGRIGRDTRINAVTLACFGSPDLFIATTQLATPVKPIKGAAMSITVTLNLE